MKNNSLLTTLVCRQRFWGYVGGFLRGYTLLFDAKYLHAIIFVMMHAVCPYAPIIQPIHYWHCSKDLALRAIKQIPRAS